ncbi:MAG: TonB-dependent receptor plug domain-containing protein [Gammaproteobacteria bacterium]
MYRRILMAAAIATACLPSTGTASDTMDNMVVRGSRTPQPVTKLSSSVSVIQREQIEERKAVFVTDYLQDLPGVAVSRAGAFGTQTQVRVRGAEANHALVVIDGVEVNDPAGGDEFSFEQLTSWEVENIEVIRGPQSALWGSDAMAGVINITTRRAQDEFSAGAFGETGSFDTRFFGGHLGTNFGRGSVDFSASSYDTDGENISRSGNEEDGFENLAATLQANIEATDQLELSMFSRFSDGTSEFDSTANTGLPEDAPLESDIKLFILRTTAELGLLEDRWTQLAQFTYVKSDRDNKDPRAATDPFLDEPVDYEAARYGFQFQTSYDFNATAETNRLTLAVDHQRDEYEQKGDLFFGSPVGQNQEMDNTGIVAEYLLEPLDNLNLSGSLRYDDNSDFKDETTWRLGGTLRFDATGTRLRATAGKGQKSPTFTERFGFFPGSFIGNPDLRPEESLGFDVGLVQDMFGGRAQATVSYFRDRVEDEIASVFDPVAGASTSINLDGNSRRQGVETSLQASLPADIDARASYTYTNAKQPDANNGGNRREIRRPRQMAALNLNYDFLNDRADVNLNVSYTGKQKDDVFRASNGFAEERLTLDDYTLVDITASFEVTEEFSVYARAENLFDEDYENIFGYKTPGQGYYAGLRMRLR